MTKNIADKKSNLNWLFLGGFAVYLIMALTYIAYEVAYLEPASVITESNPVVFPLFYRLSRYFDLLANGLFALIIALVLRILDERTPADSKILSRSVSLCAVFHLLSGIAGIAQEFNAISHYLRSGSWMSLFLLVGVFQPALYAFGILVIYRKFSALARFREEVA